MAGDGKAAAGEGLGVMSFNVRTSSAGDGQNAWALRREQVVRVIEGFGPDVLGAQECYGDQVAFLRERLGGYGFVGVGRDDGKEGGEYVPLFYRTGRFEQVDGGVFWLSQTPEQVGSRGWDADLPRVATWVELRDRRAGWGVVCVNVHFDHRGALARAGSAALVRRWIDARGGEASVVVMGDFNDVPGSAAHRRLLEPGGRRLVDAFGAVVGADELEQGTFHGFCGRVSMPRIDWIFHSEEWGVEAAAVDRSQEAGRYPSDHFPVMARLTRLAR